MIIRTAKEIGAMVRDGRGQLGLTQAELAERTGVSRLWIVQLEKGKPSAQLGLVLRTLNQLGIPLHAQTGAPESLPPQIARIDLDKIIQKTLGKTDR